MYILADRISGFGNKDFQNSFAELRRSLRIMKETFFDNGAELVWG